MDKHNSKEEERVLLLSKICPSSYAGRSLEENLLFKLCRELKSTYCLDFNETGYDENYNSFESERVIKEIAKMITDQQLADFLGQNKEKLNDYHDFNGEFYTFYGKERRFVTDSRWSVFQKLIDEYVGSFGTLGRAVLEAILELNEQGRRFKNYYKVLVLAMRKGFKKGVKGQSYITLLSELQVSRIIDPDLRDLHVPQELIPLVQDVLRKSQ